MPKRRYRLVFILIVFLIAGCIIAFFANDKIFRNSSEKIITKSPTFTTEDPAEETIELVAWMDLEGANAFEQKYIDLYNSMYENYKIKVVSRPKDLDTDTMAAMMSKSAPDILILSYDEIIAYSYMGALLPLDDYFETWDDFQNINRDSLNKLKVGEHYYGLPRGEYAMGILYNKQIFRENNITVPEQWTWNDFIEISRSLYDPSTGQYGFALNWNQWGNWWFQMFVWSAGGDLTQMTENGELLTSFTEPGVITAAEFYRTLKEQKCIQQDITLRLDQLKEDFAAGKAAMICSGLDALSEFTNLGMDADDIGVLPIPVGPDGTNMSQVGGSCYVIHSNVPPEKREAVFKYYELISSKEYFLDKIDYYHSYNIPFLQGQLRTDIDYTKLLNNISPDIMDMMEKLSQTGRASYYGMPIVSSFIDSALQQMMLDDSSDIEKIFRQAEKEVNSQAVPQFNENFH